MTAIVVLIVIIAIFAMVAIVVVIATIALVVMIPIIKMIKKAMMISGQHITHFLADTTEIEGKKRRFEVNN
jgi:nitrate/nitrite-specific signal transduction histidine kinase